MGRSVRVHALEPVEIGAGVELGALDDGVDTFLALYWRARRSGRLAEGAGQIEELSALVLRDRVVGAN